MVSNSEPAPHHSVVRSTWSWSLFDFGFQSFMGNLLKQLFHGDLLRVVSYSQQIRVPLVLHRLDTLKPYQGFLDPIGSFVSQQIQPRAHVFDMDRHHCDGRTRCLRRPIG